MELPLRIIVVNPPPGVTFAVQSGRKDLVPPARTTSKELGFELSVRLGTPRDGKPNLLGAVAQGTPAERFIYVNSGTLAGQKESCWTRRAKVFLTSIKQSEIDEVLSNPKLVLEARFAGTGPDGGPSCAKVPLVDGAWKVVKVN